MLVLVSIWVWVTVGLLLALRKSEHEPDVKGVTLRRIILFPLWYWLC